MGKVIPFPIHTARGASPQEDAVTSAIWEITREIETAPAKPEIGRKAAVESPGSAGAKPAIRSPKDNSLGTIGGRDVMQTTGSGGMTVINHNYYYGLTGQHSQAMSVASLLCPRARALATYFEAAPEEYKRVIEDLVKGVGG